MKRRNILEDFLDLARQQDGWLLPSGIAMVLFGLGLMALNVEFAFALGIAILAFGLVDLLGWFALRSERKARKTKD